jgi:hypothetical protein
MGNGRLLTLVKDPGIEISDWAMGWQPAEARYNTTVCDLKNDIV